MDERTRRIAELNDLFRSTFAGGKVVMTAGVDALPSDVKAMLIRKVATFDELTPDNDPHGEHDFGAIELSRHKFSRKISCYDANMEFGSADPADPSQTTRRMT